MRVLRTLRRRKIKLSFIILLLSVFMFNSYAWFAFDKSAESTGLVAKVTEWNVEFILDGTQEIEEDVFTIEVDEFYPGMEPVEKTIDIYHVGTGSSTLSYEVASIYLYGEEIYNNETVGEKITDDETGITTANVFGNSNATIFDANNSNYSFSLSYPTPFTITYSYNKELILGETEIGYSPTWVKFNLAWENDETNNAEDTRIGNMAYDYRVNDETGEPPLKIIFEITAKRVI